MRPAGNDNTKVGSGQSFGPSGAALLLPAAVIFAGYGAVLALLWQTQRLDTALGTLIAAVLAVGVPLIAAHAFLRILTIRLQPLAHAVFLHPGFPRAAASEIPYQRIVSVTTAGGLSGRMTGSASVTILRDDGMKFTAAAIADAEAARKAIERQRVENARGPVIGEDTAYEPQVAVFMH